MDIELARFNMIEQQIRPAGVNDARVLAALATVPRELFVPEALRPFAFADLELPLANGERMLRPLVAARLVQALAPHRGERVLEVGSGSGYVAALLAECGAHVQGVERHAALAEAAQQALDEACVDRVDIATGEGAQGWADAAPYDAILATGSVAEVPQAWCEQLREGGRVVAVVGQGAQQHACRYVKQGGRLGAPEWLFHCVLPALALPRVAAFAL